MKRFTALLLALLIGFSPSTPAPMVMAAGPVLFVDAPSGTDPYPWFPALDLNTIPFHTASGAWGAQLPVVAPTAPTITSYSNAATLAELEAALEVTGRQVTITANISGGGVGYVNPVSVTDVEVIIPNGILVNGIFWGGGSGLNNTSWTRVKFTKASGDTIGGQIHGFVFVGSTMSDIVIDGIQITTNQATSPGIGILLLPGAERVAIVNTQGISEGSFFGYGATHLVVAGSSIQHDADLTSDTGDWGFRQGAQASEQGPYIYFRNDIRGEHYSHIRVHPSASAQPIYTWVSENVFVDRGVEARAVDFMDTAESAGYPALEAGWVQNNTFYVNANTAVNSDRGGSPIIQYLRITNNTVHGDTGDFSTGSVADGVSSGNTFNAAAGSDPAWGAAGDPTGIDWASP